MSAEDDKRAAAEVAARIEQGIERYSAGDLAGAAQVLEEALRLAPGSAEAAQYLSWVRQLQTGRKKIEPERRSAVDADLIQVVTDALGAEVAEELPAEVSEELPIVVEPPVAEAQLEAQPAAAVKSPAPAPSPVPAPAPSPTPEAMAFAPRVVSADQLASLDALDWSVSSTALPSLPGAAAAAAAPSAATTDATAAGVSEKSVDGPWDPVPLTPTGSGGGGGREPPGKRSSSTLLGLAPATPLLVPPAARASARTPRSRDEETGTGERRGGGDFTTSAGTRRWSATTGVGLPPLEVPELTEEQISELIALDGSPYTPSGGTGTGAGTTPGTDARPTEARGPVVELEAEPEEDPTKGWAPRLLALEDDLGGGFDEGDETPTRDRSELLRQISGYRQRIGDTIQGGGDAAMPPLDEEGAEALPPPPAAHVHPPALDEGGDDDATSEHRAVARRSTAHITSQSPVLAPIEPLETALEQGDGEAAFAAAEEFVAEAGGIDSERCRERQWLLAQAYELAVGSLDAIPVHGRLVGELDPRGAFLLSRIDGMGTVDDLLEVSGMPRLEALRLLALLIRRGAVILR